MFSENLQLILTFLVLLAVFACFIKEWVSSELAALGGMSVLIILGVLRESDLKVVFGNPAPITIGAMFIVSEALVRTGAIDAIAIKFSEWAGKSMSRALVIIALIVVPLSALMNNTPVVVVFLPVIMAFSRSSGLKASKLLIPLSFLSILGGTMTLVGTSTNLLVASVAKDGGQPPFGIFEISKLGAIYAAIGFTYLYFFGSRLLPSRDTVSSLLDAEDTRRFLSGVKISEDSPLIGERLIEHPLFSTSRRTIVYEVIRQGIPVTEIPLDAMVMREGDILHLRATSKQLAVIKETEGLKMMHDRSSSSDEKKEKGPEIKTVEAIIGNKSSLIGRTIRSSNLRRHFGVVVAAVHRKGENVEEGFQDTLLQFGDTLLIEGPVDNLVRLQQRDDFLSLNELNVKAPRNSKVLIAVGILLGVIACSAFEVMSITSAALVGAVAVLLTRCVDVKDAYKSIQWSILFLIYGMLAIGRAMENTGGAEMLANQVVGVMAVFGPVAILAAIYMLSSLLTEMVTNNAVAILLTPIVISIAGSLGVDPRPFIVAVMFGASASFTTPIGYQTNTYVYGAGGYKFSDFVKVGVPLNIILWIAATILIPLFWPFEP
ncbi:SLC13 family permease [Verrucomicrobiales bacterium]|nr:SLC13 family permease [Verrucomicrobiales bacterium]